MQSKDAVDGVQFGGLDELGMCDGDGEFLPLAPLVWSLGMRRKLFYNPVDSLVVRLSSAGATQYLPPPRSRRK